MDVSRDQDSFPSISRQGSILTLCHGGDSESTFKNTSVEVGFNCRGPSRKILKVDCSVIYHAL